MKLRVLFLLLSLLLAWSGLTKDRFAVSAASISMYGHTTHAAVVLSQQDAGSEGDTSSASPTHAAEEAVLDLVGLLPAGTDIPCAALLTSRPPSYDSLAWIAPYIAGLKRPPRSPHLFA